MINKFQSDCNIVNPAANGGTNPICDFNFSCGHHKSISLFIPNKWNATKKAAKICLHSHHLLALWRNHFVHSLSLTEYYNRRTRQDQNGTFHCFVRIPWHTSILCACVVIEVVRCINALFVSEQLNIISSNLIAARFYWFFRGLHANEIFFDQFSTWGSWKVRHKGN